ncbi:hypothetical protein BB029_26790 [Pseudomonas sp. S3E12]|nr:hypothetical protein BB029_26790 [Pseudomonas sp. S3E12]
MLKILRIFCRAGLEIIIHEDSTLTPALKKNNFLVRSSLRKFGAGLKACRQAKEMLSQYQCFVSALHVLKKLMHCAILDFT